MGKQKKVPIRKCLATNQPFPKQEMFRIVRTPEGVIAVDDTGKMNGRGGYISKSKEAIELARTRKVLDRHLERKVNDDIYQALMDRLGGK
ncbi:MAG: YlxR family protein [Bacilli bacterium]|jgi:predicted RNA-binding protein YlxR (DUF448 family)|nr:YlxR family protein [Bacilli bacterium]